MQTSSFSPVLACRPLFRRLGWVALAILIWGFSSKATLIVLCDGAFLYAMFKRPTGSPVWRTPAGLAFLLLALFTLALLPLSTDPLLSTKSALKSIHVAAGALAIPVIFNTRARLQSALLASATAITLILGSDLIRLVLFLKVPLLTSARVTKPYVLNHPNVASMMAGAAFFVLLHAAWASRRRPALCLLGVLGAAVDLFYIWIMASRGPQGAFAAACALSGFLLPGWRKKLIWAVALSVAIWGLSDRIVRINPRFQRKDALTFNERVKVWEHTWRLAGRHPVLGYGFGKELFRRTYYETHPPKSRFLFPHTHQYWLKILFESGWAGVAIHAAAWFLLFAQLAARMRTQLTLTARSLSIAVLLLLAMVHAYGMIDYPDHVVKVMLIWLVPVALVTAQPDEPAPGVAPPKANGQG
jgi:O-antigen ligase